eukprot:8927801-Pyramimonas_sp.AAC.1
MSGKPFGYPPLHTHHDSSTEQGRWHEMKSLRNWGPVLTQFGATSFRHADFVSCVVNESDTNACAYLKLPRSHAFFINNGSFNTANNLHNIVGNPWEQQDFDQDSTGLRHIRRPLVFFGRS